MFFIAAVLIATALISINVTYAAVVPMTPANFIDTVGLWLAGVLTLIGTAVDGVADLFWNKTTGAFTLIGLLALFGLGLSFMTFGISFLLSFLKKG
jgi:hypothetical protein